MPGIISQLKSVVQFICGHVGGVAETQKNFPRMSHCWDWWHLFCLSSSPHVAVVHHSQQQGEERKNGEGSSQALGRGTSPSLSAIQMENEDPADVSYQSDACH